MNEGNQAVPSAPKQLQPVGEPGFASRAQLNRVIRGVNDAAQSLGGVPQMGEPGRPNVPQPNVRYRFHSRTALGVYRARLIENTKNNQALDLEPEDIGTPRDDARLIVWSLEEMAIGRQLFKTDEDNYLGEGDIGAGVTIQRDEATQYPIVLDLTGKQLFSVPGIIVCRGPHNEPDFKDNWQWVRILKVSAECDQTEKWELLNTPDIPELCKNTEPPTDESSSSSSSSGPQAMPNIVACFNFGNSVSGKHEQPGKLVMMTPLIAEGGAKIRWACEYIDKTDNGRSCDESSSSDKSSSEESSSVEPSSSTSASSSRGSDKSTAIVPASWSPTGYTALFVAEGPEVRFDDVIIATVQQRNSHIAIDPRFIEVCEPGSVEVCSCVADQPVAMGASVRGGKVHVRFGRRARRKLRLVIRLTGIRKGFSGHRFPDRTREQFEANERFIRSAYPGS